MMSLPIYEQFYTWQGEGIHAGKSAYFIRTHGCPVKCPWCDSAGTWHPDYAPETIEKFSAEQLLIKAKEADPEFVVITGGEPTIHNLHELTTIFHEAELPVHLETSGAFEIKGSFDWITLSPKRLRMPLAENIELADEIKIIVEDAYTIDFWLKRFPQIKSKKTVWLVPEWSQRDDKAVLASINSTIKSNKNPYRAGYQMHKLFRVDEEDSSVREYTPLGGDTSRGY